MDYRWVIRAGRAIIVAAGVEIGDYGAVRTYPIRHRVCEKLQPCIVCDSAALFDRVRAWLFPQTDLRVRFNGGVVSYIINGKIVYTTGISDEQT